MKNKTDLYEIPYIGKAMVRDFALLGINSINDLQGKSHIKLYDEICSLTNSIHDPCVLDTYEMAIHFARTGESLPWWEFSRIRKEKKLE
ncbi:MAG: Mitomycin resistance protein mcrB [Acidimicrobiia bacterium]|nr:Mitomycin resistance protein mcrB [Acidimicrobiia bacterium]